MTNYGCGENNVEYSAGFRIKPIAPAPVGGMPLVCLIALAYDVPVLDVVGAPDWALTDLFAIDARSDGPATRIQTHAMLRTLLAERFGLIARAEPSFKTMKWVLRMARADGRLGPGIRPAEQPCVKTPQNAPVSERKMRPGQPVPCGTASDRTTLAAGGVPLARLRLPLQTALGEEIIDRTGLTGNLDYYARIPRDGARLSQLDDAGASFFTAIREELGMKLDREEIIRPAVIVERVSRPTPN